jgi:hypothetical protein
LPAALRGDYLARDAALTNLGSYFTSLPLVWSASRSRGNSHCSLPKAAYESPLPETHSRRAFARRNECFAGSRALVGHQPSPAL